MKKYNPATKSFEEVAQSTPTQSSRVPVGSKPSLIGFPEIPGATDVGIGVAKGVASTVRGLGQIGENILSQTGGRLANLASGKGFTPTQSQGPLNPNSVIGQKVSEVLKPQGTAQKIGFYGEQAAEFLLPATKAAKAEVAVSLLSKGIKSPILSSLTRIGGKGVIQGISSGSVRLAQTGGDIQEAAKTGATAGILRSGFATIGEGSRALKIPERLYSTIFKNTKQDMLKELNNEGINALRRNDPTKFEQFVKEGLIKVSENGTPKLNETLAEKALNRGLSGSIKAMSNKVVAGTLEAESKARAIANNYTKTIPVKEKQFVNVLNEVKQNYKNVGLGEISREAGGLLNKLKISKGNLSATDALNLRRFLDKMRIASSFDKPATSLSMTQSNFKTLSDVLRTRVNNIPGMSDVMKDYSFYINALESLSKEAARRGNSQVISLIDSIFLGGGMVSPEPAGLLTVGVARKLIQSGKGMTGLGQAINKANISPITSGAIGAASKGVQSILSDQ